MNNLPTSRRLFPRCVAPVGGLSSRVPFSTPGRPPWKVTLRTTATRLLLLASGALACAETTSPPPPEPPAPPGTLTLTVQGLPAGVDAAVTVTGPGGFSRVLTATATLSDLSPGAYTVTAGDVPDGITTYAPTPKTQNVSVASNATATATVTYALVLGSLTVTIEGLPADVNPDVTVTGPGGFSEAVSETVTYSGLTPGTYTVTAAVLAEGSTIYEPAPVSQDVTVPSRPAASAVVTYGAVPGDLVVTIEGLPAGVDAAVTVTGPGGFTQELTASTTLIDLIPGTYTVAAAAVTEGSARYDPTPASQEVAVVSDETATATATYSLVLGSLAVTIEGAPAGLDADVTVTGPDGFSQTVTETVTLSDLIPGTYTVAAMAVTAGNTTYAPTPVSQDIAVASDETAAATVTYTLVPGALTVTIEGLPAGLEADVTVTGPDGFSQAVSETVTLGALVPGSYTVMAEAVTDGSVRYAPTPASQDVAVVSDETADATVTYAPPPISGRVIRANDGVPFVDVRVWLIAGSDTTTARTDPAGVYEFGDVAPGDYVVRVAPEDLPPFGVYTTPEERAVTLAAGATMADVDFGYRVAEVEVRITADNTTASVGSEVEFTVEALLTDVPLDLSGVNGAVTWPSAAASYVAESAVGAVWSIFLANEDPAGTLSFVGVATPGVAGTPVVLMTFRASLSAAGDAEFVPALGQLTVTDPATGETTDLLDVALVTVTTVTVTVQ